ncbi:MAG: DUF484 family protein [Aestuariibacter sp.]
MSDNNNNTAELNERLSSHLTPEAVKDYLLAHPEFFLRYPLVLEEITLPHAAKGAVSLVELQSEQLRERVKDLQDKISQIMSVAKQNEQLYRIYADLHLKLFHCENLDQVVAALEECVKDKLQLQAVSLKIFSGEQVFADADWQHLLEHRFRGKSYFFGRLTSNETAVIFGENSQVQSVGLMQLKQDEPLGMLAIGSLEDSHFHPDMDTLLINQLQQFLTLLIPQLLAKE